MRRAATPWLVLAALLPPGTIASTNVPVAGRRLSVAARGSTERALAFRSVVDAAIRAPFPDPTTGAALLLELPVGPGQCRATVTLPPAGWTPLQGDGAAHGWRYRDPSGSAGGVRAVTVSPRRIAVKARGVLLCGFDTAQGGAVGIAVRVGGTRYCAEFGGRVRTNRAGRYLAIGAGAPSRCLGSDVTVASLNVLHGIFCPAATAGCRRTDRIAAVRDFVQSRGCPDVLALQEVMNLGGPSGENAQSLPAALVDACPSPYAVVYLGGNRFDDEMILSRFPVLSSATLDLLGPLRNVLHARIDHPAGALDVYATHLASGSDLATGACGVAFGEPCPAACVAAGANTVRDCQAVQLAEHVAATHVGPAVALVVGDLNETQGSFVYDHLARQGWDDTYLAAGNPECIPASGIGCTAGRIDDALTDLESPAFNQAERIDFIWRVPPGAGAVCAAVVEPAGDADGDGIATRLFADEPAPGCGPAPARVCWASDHSGVQADLNCP